LFVVLGGASTAFGGAVPSSPPGPEDNDFVLQLRRPRAAAEEASGEEAPRIADAHGVIQLDGEGLWIKNLSPDSRGTDLDGCDMLPKQTLPLRRSFTMTLLEKLMLKGRLYRPAGNCPVLKARVTGPLPRPRAPDASIKGPVDCLYLRRGTGPSTILYVILYRMAAVGSSPYCPVRVCGEGVAPIHALLLRHRGLLLTCPAEGVIADSIRVDGVPLQPDTVAPVPPGVPLHIGEQEIRFEEVSAPDLLSP
ncbi:hypothetical protein ACFL59_07055, partial [Planctomycetota bacterium]